MSQDSFCWTIWVFSAPYRNLAAGQPAFQETTIAANQGASLAVDGGARATIHSDFTCSATTDGTSQPWWAVDLGRSYPITAVSILNRLECCGRINIRYFLADGISLSQFFSLVVSPCLSRCLSISISMPNLSRCIPQCLIQCCSLITSC